MAILVSLRPLRYKSDGGYSRVTKYKEVCLIYLLIKFPILFLSLQKVERGHPELPLKLEPQTQVATQLQSQTQLS